MTDDGFKSLGHVFDKECVNFLQENLLNESKKLKKMQ